MDTYLQVVTWQTAALNNQRNDLDILQRRLDASVLLVKALGRRLGYDKASAISESTLPQALPSGHTPLQNRTSHRFGQL